MTYDILIIGGGIVGSSLALALARESSFSIAILEANALHPVRRHGIHSASGEIPYHHRVSAISLASQRIFQNLDVWDSLLEKRVSPFTHMRVLDSFGKSEIQFDSSEISCAHLGYIIENNVIHSSLTEKINTCSQIKVISPITLQLILEKENCLEIVATDGRCFQAACVIAADGAQSWVRSSANIAIDQHDYGQTAIVATVKTTDSHQKTARQVFLQEGTLAFLPLVNDELSSIVWSLPKARAHYLMTLEDDAFRRELQLQLSFFPDLGEIAHIDKRYQFQLSAHQAKQYVKPRLALVGDSAHVIHPLAGQGLNLGLLDAASLAEVMIEAYRDNRDFSALPTLRRYERWRRADNMMMQKGVHAIFNLFNNQQAIIKQLRSFGLSMTNQVGVIKNFFIRYAVGERQDLPKLAGHRHCEEQA